MAFRITVVSRTGWYFKPFWGCTFCDVQNTGSVIVLLDQENLSLSRNFYTFWAAGETLSDELVRPRNSACLPPKWQFAIVNFNRVSLLNLKTTQKFRVKSVALLTAIPISLSFFRALVSFDDWVQVLAHEAQKRRHRSTKIFWESFVCKNSASGIECKHSYRWVVRHLETVVCLGAIEFSEERLPCQVLCCFVEVLTGWLFSTWSYTMRMLIFLRSTRRRSFPLGVFWAKMGLGTLKRAVLSNIPYLCIKDSSMMRSSFRWIGFGIFYLYTALSCFGVNSTINSGFIPISIRCLAKKSQYSTRISSTACFSAFMSSMSMQSNCSRFFFLDWALSFFYILQFIDFFEDSYLYWGMILIFTKIFRCRKPEWVFLLFWLTCSKYLNQVNCQILITFRNHTEDCNIYWFDIFGLLWSDYGELGNLCIFSDHVKW